MDSFSWGYVKDTVYITPVPDISTLMTQIQEAILTITAEIFANTWAEISVSKFSEPPMVRTRRSVLIKYTSYITVYVRLRLRLEPTTQAWF